MRLRWYFDFISPFAFLHWQRLRSMHGHEVEPVPIVFGAVLSARGQKGPAEIPGKREFTYRHVLWLARQAGIPMRFPPAHPFNPIPALRLCIAAGSTHAAVDALFDWLWREGRAGDSADALVPVAGPLGIAPGWADDEAVRARLRANTDAAIAAGVFGVPTLASVDGPHAGTLFWGNDAHDFALATLADPGLLADPEMQRLAGLPVGIQRRS